jgi:hypothetical protein
MLPPSISHSGSRSSSVSRLSLDDLREKFLTQERAMKDARLTVQVFNKLNLNTLKVDDEECIFDGNWDESDYEGLLSDSDDFDSEDGEKEMSSSATSLDGDEDEDEDENVAGPAYGREWLLNRCLKYLSRGSNTMDIDELTRTLETALLSPSGGLCS